MGLWQKINTKIYYHRMKKLKSKKRRRASKVLHKESPTPSHLLLDFFHHTPDVVYFKDKKGRLILVNEAHALGLGLKPAQVVGKTDFDIFSHDRAARMAEDDQHVMKTGKPIIDKVERATRPDGIDNYVSTTKIPRYDARGRVVGLMGITRDVTKRVH